MQEETLQGLHNLAIARKGPCAGNARQQKRTVTSCNEMLGLPKMCKIELIHYSTSTTLPCSVKIACFRLRDVSQIPLRDGWDSRICFDS